MPAAIATANTIALVGGEPGAEQPVDGRAAPARGHWHEATADVEQRQGIGMGAAVAAAVAE